MPPYTYDFEETKRQLRELIKIRSAKRDRMAVLQVQAAQFGLSVPPHIATEIEDIDGEIISINGTIARLSSADDAQRDRDVAGTPSGNSLVAVSVVPATINERLLVLTLSVEHMKDELRRNFTAVHLSQQRDTEALWTAITDTRDQVSGEQRERVNWQDKADATRKAYQQVIVRWLWIIGAALVLLFVIMLIYVAVQYVQDLLAQRAH